MVYYVLELYLCQKREYIKQSRLIANQKRNIVVTYICLIVLSILGIVLLFIPTPIVFCGEIISFITLLALLSIFDRNNIKNSQERIKTYDEFLKELHDAMIVNGVNWADPKNLDYLISECDNVVNVRSQEHKKIIRYAEIIVLPLAKFVVDIVKEREELVSINEIFSLVVAILIMALVVYVIINLATTIIEILLKTDSITEVKQLRRTLMDIKIKYKKV